MYEKSGIEERRIAFVPKDAADLQMTQQQRSTVWMEAANEMAKRAIQQALNRAGATIDEVLGVWD